MRGSAASRTGVAPGGALAGPWVSNPLWSAARALPSLDLRFAESKSLTDAASGQSLVTFTRASSGTYVGSDGALKTATTNLLLRSEEFNDAAWTKVAGSVTANAITAPNGQATADLFTEDSSTGQHDIRVTSPTFTDATAYTISIYGKANGRQLQIIFPLNTAGHGATFDLTNGTFTLIGNTVSASILPVGNGWYRCICTATKAGGTGTNTLRILTNNGTTNNYTGDGTSGIYLWGAQLEQSSTVGEYIPTTSTINSAPRFDHNPTTGESLGLLVEEQRTNSIRNNTMVGAVAGTPGTLPTNWVFIAGTTGISSQVVESGVVNGINYIDVRYFGTAAATSSFSQRFEGATSIAALTGQTWALSTWTKIQAGSTSGITAINHQYVENTSAGAFVTSGTTAITVDSNFTRHTSTRALSGGATVAFLAGGISVTVTSGQAIDITLRIGLPQLEQGAFATSVIPTTGTAATRSADVASITGTNFSSWYRQGEGTIYGESRQVGDVLGFIASVSDGTDNNRIAQFRQTTTLSSRCVQAGTATNPGNIAIVSSQTLVRSAIAVTASSCGVAANGVLGTDSAPSALPVVDRLGIGLSAPGATQLNGTIRRLCYWGQRLPNSTLQVITQ